MTKALVDELVAQFPNLYQQGAGDYSVDRHKRYNNLTCDDGWYHLLHSLSAKLEAEILSEPERVRRAYSATTVKEKFGQLDFNMTHVSKKMDKLIRSATKKSKEVCEFCGDEGKLNYLGRIKVRCSKHWKNQNEPVDAK